MDYSTINSWEDFSDRYTEILKDFIKNFDDVENRINCVDCFFRNHPTVDLLSDKPDMFDEMNVWKKYYKQIMYLYCCNSYLSEIEMRIGLMWADILKTEPIRTLDDKEKERYYEQNTNMSNEVKQYIKENKMGFK